MIRFTAEIGSNHNSSINRAKKMITRAKESGFDAVKFQALPEKPSGLWRDARRVPWAHLDRDSITELAEHAHALGLGFHVSVFNLHNVYWLDKIVDGFKIGSYEILCHDMIRKCAATGKPLALSFGNCTDDEADAAIYAAKGNDGINDLTLYHCVSEYPARLAQCNMRRMLTLCQWVGTSMGWSDHTRSLLAIYAAVGCGATAIEMHVDLDGDGREFDHGHCWLFGEAEGVIGGARKLATCLGDVDPSENAERLAQRTDPSDYKRPLIEEGEGQ